MIQRNLIGGMLWLGILVGTSHAQTWLEPDFPYRRKVSVPAPKAKPDAANPEVGWADLPTFDAKLDGAVGSASGSAVKVIGLNGTERPCRVLSAGPGSRMRVAWALSNDNGYFLYFGGPPKPAIRKIAPNVPTEAFGPAYDWTPQRGLLLESWAYRGGLINTLNQTQETLQQAANSPLQGAGFVDDVFRGHNPFGPPGAYCHRYTGYFLAPREGTYLFALSCSDAGFVFLDDQPLIDWPGRHRWVGDIRHNAQVALKPQTYKLTVLYANTGTPGGISLCWQPPGAGRAVPIPVQVFLPVHQAELDKLEAKTGPTPYFDWRWKSEAFYDNFYSQRFEFVGKSPEQLPGLPLTWTITGGGTHLTAEGGKLDVVFLSAGDYTVSLSVPTSPPKTLTATVRVERPWDHVAEEDTEPLQKHADLVRPTLQQRGPAELAMAIRMFDKLDDSAGVLEAGRILFLERNEKLDEQTVAIVDRFIAAAIKKNDVRLAVECLLAGEERAAGATIAAALGARVGQVALDELDDVALAQPIFKRVVDVYGKTYTGDAIRKAKLGLGDCYRRQGDTKKAAETYTAAGEQGDPMQKMLLISSAARSVEDYIRRAEWQAADEAYQSWVDRFPMERLTGYAGYLRAKWWAGQGRSDRAIREADVLLGVNEKSLYTPMAMLLKAELLEKDKKHEEAVKTWQLIVDRFPEHEAAGEARKRLGKK